MDLAEKILDLQPLKMELEEGLWKIQRVESTRRSSFPHLAGTSCVVKVKPSTTNEKVAKIRSGNLSLQTTH